MFNVHIILYRTNMHKETHGRSPIHQDPLKSNPTTARFNRPFDIGNAHENACPMQMGR